MRFASLLVIVFAAACATERPTIVPPSVAAVSRVPEVLPETPAPPDPPPPQPRVVLHAGDSMVGGNGLARALEARFKPFGTKYVRDWRVATVQTFDYANYFGKLLDEHKPDLVILNLGANDVFVPNPKVLARFVERIAQKATQNGRTCYWITPPLWKPPDTGIIEVIKEHAAPCRVFDSSDLALPKWPDGIHPNNEGGALWAEKFWAFYETARQSQI